MLNHGNSIYLQMIKYDHQLHNHNQFLSSHPINGIILYKFIKYHFFTLYIDIDEPFCPLWLSTINKLPSKSDYMREILPVKGRRPLIFLKSGRL